MSENAKMSFMEHLEELRLRLIRCLVALFVGMIICWFFKDQILSFLLAPLYEAWRNVDGLPEPKPLNFSSMLEPFVAYLKMSAIGGVFLGAPVILYQLWRFISPGLYIKERRLALPFVLVSSILFIGGSTMAYSVVFPLGFRFFLDFAAGREMADLEAEVALTGVPEEPVIPLIVDAGVFDGGVESDSAGSTPGSIETTGVPDKNDNRESWSERFLGRLHSWSQRILGRLLGKSCGEFQANATDPGPAVELLFKWHTVRCGDPPILETLQRNETPIHVDWRKDPSSPNGYTIFNATDDDYSGKRLVYRLRVPSSPGLKQLAPVLMVKDYLSFAIRLLLAFGLIFELPILISFLALAGIVDYKQLIKFSRWFLVISVILGAMLTPPDVITQLLLAMPLMLLYFLSVVFAYIFGPRPKDEKSK